MSAPHIGFVLERTLGHITHADNLRRFLATTPTIDAELIEVDYDVDGTAARIPVFGSNWTVRAGVRGRQAVRRADRERRLDGLFIHTQVLSVLMTDWVRRLPTVISVDATPLQYDELGEHYGHERSGSSVEKLKWRANRAAFEAAAHIVSWSDWAKQGLVDGYGVDPEKVTVVPPGVLPALWERPAERVDGGGPVRILFVGGDAARKGGPVLLEAFALVRARLAEQGLDVRLDMATGSTVAPMPGLTVHHGLRPNSAELIQLFHEADIFCLPTKGDCLPMVLSEAGAAGLPLVSTPVAAIPEIVRPGETGVLVAADDVGALADALEELATDASLRRRLGEGARRLVRERYDAHANAAKLARLLVAEVGARRRATAPRRTLLAVSGVVPETVVADVERGERPCPDYVAMASAMDADIVDVAAAREQTGRIGALVERVGGAGSLMAWACFRDRRGRSAIVTDGEHVGLPLAALCRLGLRRSVPHLMVVHTMSVPKKQALYRALRLGRYVDAMVVYSSEQRRVLTEELGVAAERILLTPFAVDTAFFAPDRVVPATNGTVISSAGLELRDYDTLLEAARGLDVKVVIAAASPWSKRADGTAGAELPGNVEVCRLGFQDLRQLYADSSLVVVPLLDVPFQAGITTILEGMSMAKPVVCSRTKGQTDVVVDGVTGAYVPVGDADALRGTITGLLDQPSAGAIGQQARDYCVQTADVHVYAERVAAALHDMVIGPRGAAAVPAR